MRRCLVFISDSSDPKRVFETIRMALGITLRGNKVKLVLSPDVSLDFSDDKMKGEVEEFLSALKYMGGEFEIKNFEDIEDDFLQYDSFILAI
ncbi:hypothetical protein HRbin19_00213 [bacterium HR19]|nr:hypothetical protein HRbin19_00213 [bacterium HR19]